MGWQGFRPRLSLYIKHEADMDADSVGFFLGTCSLSPTPPNLPSPEEEFRNFKLFFKPGYFTVAPNSMFLLMAFY